MKVKDLIRLLKQFDGEKKIIATYNGGEYTSDLATLKLIETDQHVEFKD
jgi:hypothetical protein